MKAALLCLFVVLFTATTCNSSRNPCVCLKTSNITLPPSRVISYYVQKSGLCHITAAVITTVTGRTICADLNKSWVIKGMKLVDERKKADSTTARPMSTASKRTVITQAAKWDKSCCLKKISVKNRRMKHIVDCKVQRCDVCPFDAIIIRTHKGRKLCFDTQEEWVLKNVVLNGTDTCNVILPKTNARNNKKAGRGRKRKAEQEKGTETRKEN